MSKQGFPNIPQPAVRALKNAGYTNLAQLRAIPDAELLKLHGMGPKGVRIIRDALKA